VLTTPEKRRITLIDTHAHLDSPDYQEDRAAVIARAFSESIGVITIGINLQSSEEAAALAKRHRLIWAAVGVHPHNATTIDESGIARLEELAQEKKVVAVGEIGLDYYRDLSPRKVQRHVFSLQLDLAAELHCPIIIHNRESTSDLLAILRHHGSSHRGVIHSFLGDRALAEEFLALGFHLGIGGPLTFAKNGTLRSAVKSIPLERVLVETDSPYLTPVPYRGKRNEPGYVRYVAEALAQIKEISAAQVEEETTKNAIELFSKLSQVS